MKHITGAGVARLWKNMKEYVTENTYPKVRPPDLFFDPETATLYTGPASVGYEFLIDNAILYYRERSV